jgi:hypothetical protein
MAFVGVDAVIEIRSSRMRHCHWPVNGFRQASCVRLLESKEQKGGRRLKRPPRHEDSYWTASIAYRRMVLSALSRSGARSVHSFDFHAVRIGEGAEYLGVSHGKGKGRR